MDTVNRKWFLIDAKDQTLGRMSTKIARILTGKDKPVYTPNADYGDHVVVINAKEVKVSGKKEDQKTYYSHSGFPGGFKSELLKEARVRHPERIVEHAVKGMVPKGRLGDQIMKKLHVYAGSEHPHTNAKPY